MPRRLGKPNALNTAVALARGEILLLSDVRQRFEPTVARALVANFADAQVGAVSGDLIAVKDGSMARGDRGDQPRDGLGFYWRYERALRKAESRFRTAIHYTGAIAAIRRTLFAPLPVATLHDDVVMPLRVASAGYRVVFESTARAYDDRSRTAPREFRRKIRTQAAVLQTVLHSREFVGRLTPFVWWQFLSHTVFRLLVPYALAVLACTNALLAAPLYRGIFIAQCCVYGLGFVGLCVSKDRRIAALFSVPATFLTLNAAAVLGPLSYVVGRRLELWAVSREELSKA
jgi:poly-beta-1,6-N-acetyl-D-glucosamine synthase